MAEALKILAVNPGSTSTKVALFVGEEEVFSENIMHDAGKLSEFETISDQLPYRTETILAVLAENGVDPAEADAYAANGGGLLALCGGVYQVNGILREHARIGANGVQHPNMLAAQIIGAFADKYGKPAFIVNPPDVDELCDLARVTGLKGVYRRSRAHPLNHKEMAIRFAEARGRKYEELNLIVAHVGGGVSVAAHEHGLMVDQNDVVGGDGPMAPTRCGSIPVVDIIDLCFSGRYSKEELQDKMQKTGGFVDHLGTSDAIEVTRRIEAGDRYAKLVFDAMIYQISKSIGAMAAVLKGRVDGVILTGGIAYSEYLSQRISESVSWIADVSVMPGESEMAALSAGAIRVLTGREAALEYTGVPIWSGFDMLLP
ncbi:MAG: butyrate kinase [Clostridiales Family XIII bacterium]|jgi:butyrate kinase|nr:butyrate kinase [Clostridiales Family XIII bacterium]